MKTGKPKGSELSDFQICDIMNQVVTAVGATMVFSAHEPLCRKVHDAIRSAKDHGRLARKEE